MAFPAPAPLHAEAPVLLREDRGPVSTLTLNRPAARNSLSEALLGELALALDALSADRGIRAVVLAASGPVFCAGHDLRELTARRADPDRGRAYFTDILALCSAVMQRIVRLPQPVVAAVEGMATAAGCQLVASCDLAVAGRGAAFCTPGVHIGLFCSTPMVALSRNLAPKHAMEMLLLGEAVPAEEAHRMGLVNRLVPSGAALAEAALLAEVIASKSARAVRAGKAAFDEQHGLPLGQAYARASRVMAENMLAADAGEGIDAFLAKRAPTWAHE